MDRNEMYQHEKVLKSKTIKKTKRNKILDELTYIDATTFQSLSLPPPHQAQLSHTSLSSTLYGILSALSDRISAYKSCTS